MPRLALILALVPALVSGAHRLAAAEGADATFDPLTMDRHTPTSSLGFDFAYVAYDEPTNTDVTVMGLAFGGHYVTPKGVGGYLSIPLSYLAYQAPLGLDDSQLTIGNVEAGGLYAKRFERNTWLVLHGGLALPTASDDDLPVGQVLASSPRYGDLVHRVTNSTWLRLGASPMGRVGKLLWRADVGLDLALDEDNTPTISPVFRVGIGGGFDLGKAMLLAELVTVVINDGSNDETTSTLALGARFVSGRLRPGVGLIVPIGFDRNLFEPDFALTLSLAAHL